MAERGVIYCIRNLNIDEAVDEIRSIDASVPSENCSIRFGSINNNLTLFFHDQREWPLQNGMKDVFDIVRRIATKRKLAWLYLMIQEGSIWEYVAYCGDEEIQQFSTCRAYWNEEDQQEWMGNASQLAEVFEIDAAGIANYLIPWNLTESGTFQLSGLAYPDDQSGYGQVHQYCDFLKAMGFAHPQTTL